ncbi:MAG: hypothetical protein ACOCUU_00175 [Nanoarchaeota archaeon]
MVKKDVNFDVDERTNVPTFQEILEVLSKVEKHPHYGKIVIGLMSFFILIILGGGTYLYLNENIQMSGFLISAEGISSELTGYFTYDINKSNPEIFGIPIKESSIDLSEEEQSLKNKMITECNNEKWELKKDIQDTCEDEKEVLEQEIEEWKEKYEECEDELDFCEGSS